MQTFKGKTAVITGGSSGIGRAAAKLFSDRGARVIITGRDRQALDGAVREIGGDAYGIVSDAGSRDDLGLLQQQVRHITSSIDILFVNAGYGKFAPVELVDEQVIDELFGVLFKGSYFTVQTLLPLMNEGGAIILNTSIVTRYGAPYASVYSAAKAAVSSLVKTLASECTGRKIRVNGICPGYTKTEIFGKTGMTEEQISQTIRTVTDALPYGRFGEAEEVAAAVVFLASGEASYIHGTELVVDGGYTVINN